MIAVILHLIVNLLAVIAMYCFLASTPRGTLHLPSSDDNRLPLKQSRSPSQLDNSGGGVIRWVRQSF